jgi:hypothetical protein
VLLRGLPLPTASSPPPLPCSYAFPQQALLTIILLHFNRPLCTTNTAIQLGYGQLARRLLRRGPSRLLPALRALDQLLHPSPASRSCSAAVLAAPAWAAEAVRAACMVSVASAAPADRQGPLQALLLLSDAGTVAAAGVGSLAANGGKLCAAFQPARCGQRAQRAGEYGSAGCCACLVCPRSDTHNLSPLLDCSLLLLGFLLPTLHIWATERRLRTRFLAHKAGMAGAAWTGPPAGSTQPSLLDYAAFAPPAVTAMYSYVVVHA